MSDQQRPQRRTLRPGPTPRRVGEPNVLSNQAIPNRLSTQGTPGRSTTGPSKASPPRPILLGEPAIGRPTGASPVPSPVPGEAGRPRSRRLPSLGTLLTIGFILFWASRVIGNLGSGEDGPTATAGTGGPVPGVITFGTGLGDGCDLTGEANQFAASADVWWRAELRTSQSEDVTVVVRAYRDEGEIDRYEIPPETGTGRWEILCPGDAITARQAGYYRVEVWDEPEQALLAVGTFEKQLASP